MTLSAQLDLFKLGTYSVNQLSSSSSSVILSNKASMLSSISSSLTTYLASTSYTTAARSIVISKCMNILYLMTNGTMNSVVYTNVKSILTQLKATNEYYDLLKVYSFSAELHQYDKQLNDISAIIK